MIALMILGVSILSGVSAYKNYKKENYSISIANAAACGFSFGVSLSIYLLQP